MQALSIAISATATAENAAIADGLKRHDPDVLDHLIELYQHRLLRYLLFLTGKREVAEDLFQETALQVWHSVDAFRGDAAVTTWIYRASTPRPRC